MFDAGANAVPACSAASEPADDNPEVSQDEVRSVATSFFRRSPLSGHRIDGLLRQLQDGGNGLTWTRNQGEAFGVQWESRRAEPLDADARAALARPRFRSR